MCLFEQPGLTRADSESGGYLLRGVPAPDETDGVGPAVEIHARWRRWRRDQDRRPALGVVDSGRQILNQAAQLSQLRVKGLLASGPPHLEFALNSPHFEEQEQGQSNAGQAGQIGRQFE